MWRHIVLAMATFTAPGMAASADAIVAKSVAATQQDWNEAPRYSFIDRETAVRNGHGQPARTEQVVMIDGSPYKELVAIGNAQLSQQQRNIQVQKLARETAKRQHESATAHQRRVAKYLRDRTHDHQMLSEMVKAFQYAVTGEDVLDGHKVWVLKASPKLGYVPQSREGKVLKGMQGQLWIDQSTYQWVKVEARVVGPVSMFGFLAKVKPGTRFELDQAPVTSTLWLPKRFVVTVRASEFGIRNENSSSEDDYHDYRLQAQQTVDARGGGDLPGRQ